MPISFVQTWESPGAIVDGNNTDLSVTPSGQIPGNLLIGVCAVRLENGGFSEGPAGWNTITFTNNADLNTRAYWKIATGNDTLTDSWGTARRCWMAVAEYSSPDPLDLSVSTFDATEVSNAAALSCVTGSATASSDSVIVPLLYVGEHNNVPDGAIPTVPTLTEDYFRATGSTVRPGAGFFTDTDKVGVLPSYQFSWNSGTTGVGGVLVFAKSAAAVPPTVDAGGPYGATINTPLQLAPTVTPGSGAITLEWSADRAGVFSDASAEAPTFTPSATGAYVLTLTVTPDDGPPVADTASLTSSAGVSPPVVNAGGPYSGSTGAPITLGSASIVNGSDPSPEIAWSSVPSGIFSATNVQNPTFTAPNDGEYTLTLTVTPNDGPPVVDTATVTAATSSSRFVQSWEGYNDATGPAGLTVPVVGATVGNVLVGVVSIRIGTVTDAAIPGWTIIGSASGANNSISSASQLIAVRTATGSDDFVATWTSPECRTHAAVCEFSGVELPALDSIQNIASIDSSLATTLDSGTVNASAGEAVFLFSTNGFGSWIDSSVDVGTLVFSRTNGLTSSRPYTGVASANYTSGDINSILTTISGGGFPGVGGAVILPIRVSGSGIEFTGNMPDQTADVGIPYSYDASVNWSNAVGSVAYALTSGTPPTSINLNPSTGVLSGTPTVALSRSSQAITATDDTGSVASNSYRFDIYNQVSWDTIPGQQLTDGEVFSLDLQGYVNGGDAVYTFAEVSGTLPSGITLSNGILSGTPDAVGQSFVTFSVTSRGITKNSNSVSFVVSASGQVSITLGTGNFSVIGTAISTLWGNVVQVTLSSGLFSVDGSDMVLDVVDLQPTTFLWSINEGSGSTVKCSQSAYNGSVDPTGWGIVVNNVKRWPINEGTGAILNEVNTGTDQYDATIQNFTEGGWG